MIMVKKVLNNAAKRFYSMKRNIKDVNYQFMQRSKVPTMHFQKSLPRLPIPELSKTGERYLNALRPILTKDHFIQAEIRTKDFIQNSGNILQKLLLRKDKTNTHTSYISQYWFDLYLRDRNALPINYNPLIVFQNDKRLDYNEQLTKATNMLVSAVRFMCSLREHLLEPEVYHLNPKKSNTQLFRNVTGLLPQAISWYGAYLFKAFPLDMSQFDGLFGATRIPQMNKDTIVRDPDSKHILVQRNGNFYIFDVLDINGNLLSPGEILGNLHQILQEPIQHCENPIGILTTQNRDKWAEQRAYLDHVETKQFCEYLHSNKASKEELRCILQECSVGHSQLVKEAAMGQGFDRHMFALRKMAEENNLPIPDLYDSYEYKYLNTSILSTSTLSSPSVLAGGFGPVVKEGFGIGYSAFPDKLGAAVTSYKPHNRSSEFIEALHKSFLDITNILSN
ncbi:hypothetical protein ACJJTC_006753 [Scirpophaga incertulas]